MQTFTKIQQALRPGSTSVYGKPLFIFSIFFMLLFSSCKKDTDLDINKDKEKDVSDASELTLAERGMCNNTNADMVMTWNQAGVQAVTNMGALPPMPVSRIYAMINIAIHDALNNILPRYRTYALKNAGDRHANANAAVAQAAHDVIVNLLPPQQAFADGLLSTSLNSITEGIGKTKGIAMGKAAAAAIIALRTNDGVANAQFPYTQGTLPGQYRSTPPFEANGFVAAPGWGNVKTFGLASSSQFRPVPPYAINSHQYTADFNEVKSLGSSTSVTRTAEQTEIAVFCLDGVPTSFNRIARTMAVQKHLGAWAAARLFALLQIAQADANIACFEAKFYYNFWRPITAIRLAGTDGNPNTAGDAAWDVLAPPTPPVPDYPSNHATNAGAGEVILKEFFGDDNIGFKQTSNALPNVTRSYHSFSQAGRENCLSRIYVGYHFRNAVNKGEEQGKKVGEYIFDHYLQEK
jgi:PAP2 superfamily